MTTDAFYQPELGCRIVITDPDIPEIVPVIVCQPEPAPAEMSEHYTYRITWSDEDGEYVGLCSEFPSLSWLASTPAAARSGIQYLVSEAVADLRAAAPGIRPPHSIAIPDCPNPCAKPGAPDCQCAANAFPLPVEQSQPPAAEPAAVEPPGDCPYLATPDNCEWPACNLDGVGCRYTEAAAELRRRLNDSIFAPPASPPDVQPQPEQQNQQQAAPPCARPPYRHLHGGVANQRRPVCPLRRQPLPLLRAGVPAGAAPYPPSNEHPLRRRPHRR